MKVLSTITSPPQNRAFTVPSRLKTGREGEAIAVEFLQKLGYEIRGRNLRISRDEIDILAFDPADCALVFTEVKTRSKKDADYPAQMSAGFRKCEKLRRSARAWIGAWNYDGGYRLDLICVEGGEVTEHLKELSWDEG
jgi:putative endonuclease